MPRIPTHLLTPEAIKKLPASDAYHIYNGLDCCVTLEVFQALSKELRQQNNPAASLVYDFERGMQAPALDMMRRGIATDKYEIQQSLKLLNERLSKVQTILNIFARVIWGKDLNANSPPQLKEFFYVRMGLPEQYKSEKGVKTVSCNRESLEKLQAYFYAVPIINCIFAIRDTKKKISVLSTDISPDGRMRTSYNVAGTETGRWSSSSDAFGEGTNLQNISVELRKGFIADPGKKLGHFDQEQAESKVVGLLTKVLVNDPSYWNACNSGDLHTFAARLMWEHIKTRADAEQIFYRHFSYRDMSKRGGHACNYKVTPWTMSRHLKIALKLSQEFSDRYYSAFPGILSWHAWTASEIQLNQELTTPLGMRRIFFGNPYDDATIREAIAYVPQSVVGQLTNIMIWKIWKHVPEAELLLQEHDGFTLQYPDDPSKEADIIRRVTEICSIPFELLGHSLTIPVESSIGWNWAPGDKPPFLHEGKSTNPNGLIKWRGHDDRKRINGLDRVIC